MSFKLNWVQPAASTFSDLEKAAQSAATNRKKSRKEKASKQEGLFKQVRKTIEYLAHNPKHPSLKTHEYGSLENPFRPTEKVFEAYVQNNTPGAYRVFWCYGPGGGEITIIAITPHP